MKAAPVRRIQAAIDQAYKFTSPGRQGVPERLMLLPSSAPEFVEPKR